MYTCGILPYMNVSKLTRADIVGIVNERTGIPANEVTAVMNEVFNVLVEGLTEGMTAELRGLGTFEVKTRKGRDNARNPKTGEVVHLPDHNVVVFRPGRDLKAAVRRSPVDA